MKTQINKRTQRGNAMVYVLIALALFGFLTVTLSRQNDGADGQDIDDEQAEIYALELIEYATTAQNVVDMMLSTGSTVDNLDFVNPTSAGFNTGSHIHKVFHPQGGGLNYQEKFDSNIETKTDSGWFVRNNSHVEWTPTLANDVVLSALRINKEICENINLKITGSKSIPILTGSLGKLFDEASASPLDLDSTSCPDCDEYPSLCVENVAGLHYGFYTIIAAQ